MTDTVTVADLDLPRWTQRAACRGVRVEVFFPPNGVRPVEALAMCEGCPVRGRCLEYALEEGIAHGVYGGMTERQRYRERRRRRRLAKSA